MGPGQVEDEIERLLPRVCAGDESAWQGLWRLLDPRLDALVRRRRLLGRLSLSDEDRRVVARLVMERLRQDGYRRLKMFREERQRTRTLSFLAWLTVVARHVAIDYLRAHPDYVAGGPRRSERPGTVLPPEPPPESEGPPAQPPVTVKGTAGELLDYARRELPDPQHRALEMWMAGRPSEDIAVMLQMSNAEAQRTIRAAVERLRRRFPASVPGELP